MFVAMLDSAAPLGGVLPAFVLLFLRKFGPCLSPLEGPCRGVVCFGLLSRRWLGHADGTKNCDCEFRRPSEH